MPISRIALEAEYESEAVFSKAFKRAFGTPPATWRRKRLRLNPLAAKIGCEPNNR